MVMGWISSNKIMQVKQYITLDCHHHVELARLLWYIMKRYFSMKCASLIKTKIHRKKKRIFYPFSQLGISFVVRNDVGIRVVAAIFPYTGMVRNVLWRFGVKLL